MNLVISMISELFNLIISFLPFLSGMVQTSVFPQPLSQDEEKDCLERMKHGDISARNKLIEHNLRLVAHLVKKYDARQETEDLISIGTIGLIKGIDSFDMDKGLKLTTYVSKCIENEILMSFRKQKHHPTVSLDDPIGSDKDGNLIRLFEVIKDDNQISIIDKMTTESQIKLLNSALNQLSETEHHILAQRFGLEGYSVKTQKEIAEEQHISRSYV